jgi:TetR/AcrR family transcriptional regulator, acrAB operon repressor
MTGKPRRMDEIAEESRRRILDAAEELFREQGFERTTFADVSTRSGISRGSIPWHFGNKDGLLLAVVERAVNRQLPEDLETAGLTDLQEVLRRAGELIRGEGGDLFHMLLTQAMSSEGPVHELYATSYARRRENMAKAYSVIDSSRGAAARRRAEGLSVAFHGALVGIQMLWELDPDNVDLDESLKALADVFSEHAKSLMAKQGRQRTAG